MVGIKEALKLIQEWVDGSSSKGKGVGVGELSLCLAAVLTTIDFESLKTKKGQTPLHALGELDRSAIEGRNLQMRGSVKLLKDCGLDIDAREREYEMDGEVELDRGDGMTPLVQVVCNGHFDLVQGLVEQGADVNKCVYGGFFPLTAAAGGRDNWGCSYSCDPMIISYLMEHGARVEDSKALDSAAAAGCPESVGILLKAGAEVNEQHVWETPAQCCCGGQGNGSTSERLKALYLLLEAGADLNVKDRYGLSLLHKAASAGYSELIDELVRRGLEVDTKDSGQLTPLHFATTDGNSSSVKALIRLGASLDAVDSNKNTPLHSALQYGKEDIAAELIDAGANVNAKRDGNIAPLHLAAVWGNMRLTYLLLEAGAEVDALTNTGSSSLMVCMAPEKDDNVSNLFRYDGPPRESKEQREKVAGLLLEMGAAVSKSVMALVGESDCGDVIGAHFSKERDARDTSDRVCNTIAGHISSGSAYSEAAKEGRVVRVRLVDRTTGKRKETQYTLSIPLMELLMDKTEGEGGSSDGSDRHDTAAGSLPTMLDPSGRGFMGIKGKAKDEVEVTVDGVDFTEDGFAAVVQFVTTGSVKSLLTRGRHGQMSSSTSSETAGGGGDRRGGGSNSEEALGERKSERVKLFDDVRAEQALQAAGFFCIEAMSREVKALMTLYGFELGKETDDEPRRKRSRGVDP